MAPPTAATDNDQQAGDDEDEIVCSACGFEASYVPEGMLPCERCGQVYYCSVHCLQWDWKSGGHAEACPQTLVQHQEQREREKEQEERQKIIQAEKERLRLLKEQEEQQQQQEQQQTLFAQQQQLAAAVVQDDEDEDDYDESREADAIYGHLYPMGTSSALSEPNEMDGDDDASLVSMDLDNVFNQRQPSLPTIESNSALLAGIRHGDLKPDTRPSLSQLRSGRTTGAGTGESNNGGGGSSSSSIQDKKKLWEAKSRTVAQTNQILTGKARPSYLPKPGAAAVGTAAPASMTILGGSSISKLASFFERSSSSNSGSAAGGSSATPGTVSKIPLLQSSSTAPPSKLPTYHAPASEPPTSPTPRSNAFSGPAPSHIPSYHQTTPSAPQPRVAESSLRSTEPTPAPSSTSRAEDDDRRDHHDDEYDVEEEEMMQSIVEEEEADVSGEPEEEGSWRSRPDPYNIVQQQQQQQKEVSPAGLFTPTTIQSSTTMQLSSSCDTPQLALVEPEEDDDDVEEEIVDDDNDDDGGDDAEEGADEEEYEEMEVEEYEEEVLDSSEEDDTSGEYSMPSSSDAGDFEGLQDYDWNESDSVQAEPDDCSNRTEDTELLAAVPQSAHTSSHAASSDESGYQVPASLLDKHENAGFDNGTENSRVQVSTEQEETEESEDVTFYHEVYSRGTSVSSLSKPIAERSSSVAGATTGTDEINVPSTPESMLQKPMFALGRRSSDPLPQVSDAASPSANLKDFRNVYDRSHHSMGGLLGFRDAYRTKDEEGENEEVDQGYSTSQQHFGSRSIASQTASALQSQLHEEHNSQQEQKESLTRADIASQQKVQQSQKQPAEQRSERSVAEVPLMAAADAVAPAPIDPERNRALTISINKALRDYEALYGPEAARQAIQLLTMGLSSPSAAAAAVSGPAATLPPQQEQSAAILDTPEVGTSSLQQNPDNAKPTAVNTSEHDDSSLKRKGLGEAAFAPALPSDTEGSAISKRSSEHSATTQQARGSFTRKSFNEPESPPRSPLSTRYMQYRTMLKDQVTPQKRASEDDREGNAKKVYEEGNGDYTTRPGTSQYSRSNDVLKPFNSELRGQEQIISTLGGASEGAVNRDGVAKETVGLQSPALSPGVSPRRQSYKEYRSHLSSAVTPPKPREERGDVTGDSDVQELDKAGASENTKQYLLPVTHVEATTKERRAQFSEEVVLQEASSPRNRSNCDNLERQGKSVLPKANEADRGAVDEGTKGEELNVHEESHSSEDILGKMPNPSFLNARDPKTEAIDCIVESGASFVSKPDGADSKMVDSKDRKDFATVGVWSIEDNATPRYLAYRFGLGRSTPQKSLRENDRILHDESGIRSEEPQSTPQTVATVDSSSTPAQMNQPLNAQDRARSDIPEARAAKNASEAPSILHSTPPPQASIPRYLNYRATLVRQASPVTAEQDSVAMEDTADKMDDASGRKYLSPILVKNTASHHTMQEAARLYHHSAASPPLYPKPISGDASTVTEVEHGGNHAILRVVQSETLPSMSEGNSQHSEASPLPRYLNYRAELVRQASPVTFEQTSDQKSPASPLASGASTAFSKVTVNDAQPKYLTYRSGLIRQASPVMVHHGDDQKVTVPAEVLFGTVTRSDANSSTPRASPSPQSPPRYQIYRTNLVRQASPAPLERSGPSINSSVSSLPETSGTAFESLAMKDLSSSDIGRPPDPTAVASPPRYLDYRAALVRQASPMTVDFGRDDHCDNVPKASAPGQLHVESSSTPRAAPSPLQVAPTPRYSDYRSNLLSRASPATVEHAGMYSVSKSPSGEDEKKQESPPCASSSHTEVSSVATDHKPLVHYAESAPQSTPRQSEERNAIEESAPNRYLEYRSKMAQNTPSENPALNKIPTTMPSDTNSFSSVVPSENMPSDGHEGPRELYDGSGAENSLAHANINSSTLQQDSGPAGDSMESSFLHHTIGGILSYASYRWQLARGIVSGQEGDTSALCAEKAAPSDSDSSEDGAHERYRSYRTQIAQRLGGGLEMAPALHDTAQDQDDVDGHDDDVAKRLSSYLYKSGGGAHIDEEALDDRLTSYLQKAGRGTTSNRTKDEIVTNQSSGNELDMNGFRKSQRASNHNDDEDLEAGLSSMKPEDMGTSSFLSKQGTKEKSQQDIEEPGVRPKNKRSSRCLCLLLLILMIVGLSVGLGLGFGLKRRSLVQSQGLPARPGQATSIPGQPTLSPASLGPVSPSPTFASASQQSLFSLLASASADSGLNIKIKGTPQYQAFTWLSNSSILNTLDDSRRIQRYALATLYYSTNGARWSSNNLWLSDTNECAWFSRSSSVCDSTGSFINLSLGFNNLGGEIPPELGLLSRLTVLALSGGTSTTIGGTLPPELGGLTTLEFLSVRQNSISGVLPSTIGSWTMLTFLDVSVNDFTGQVPTEINQLKLLREIDLSDNTFDKINYFGGLSALQRVTLSNNTFAGPIDESVGQLSLLRFLNMEHNLFTSIPEAIGLLTNLEVVTAFSNRVKGELFTRMGGLNMLRVLDLHENILSGPIPTEVGLLSNLRYLDLSSNMFTGKVPSQLGGLSNLIDLLLNSNQLTGTFPVALSSLTRLGQIRVDDNKLTGTVPQMVCTEFSSTLPSFWLDCGGSSPSISCPPGPCCTYCCIQDANGTSACSCVYKGTGFEFLC